MNKLIDSFLSIDFDDDSFMNTYNVITISHFDHYLNEDEYSKAELICYSDVKGNIEKEKLFKNIEDKFIKLYESLYYLSNKQEMVCIDGNLLSLNFDEYMLAVRNAMKEKPLCQFLYPSLLMFSVAGYDLTHQFFFLKDNHDLVSLQKTIKKIVDSVDLNIIQ